MCLVENKILNHNNYFDKRRNDQDPLVTFLRTI